MKALLRRLAYSEPFWWLERRAAHALGWHNDACRGRVECAGLGATGVRHRFGRRWWRWVR